MEIIIGGDLVPTDVNISLFSNGDIKSFLGNELKKIWLSADFRVFNLEAPLTDVEEPIDKLGPNLISPTSTIKGINEMFPSLITLANNHILDHGPQGLFSTKDLLDNYNIPSIGAGRNLKEALKPYIIERENYKIGVYACAEHEFTIADEDFPGANPFDPLESLDHIQELSDKCDYVIVLYHGGKEHYRYPSPYLQKVCRKIVEKGADIVVCQHSHCVGCYEKYQDSTIIYGQGNFIFNKHVNEYWDNGILIKIKLEKNVEIEYIPIEREKRGIRLAKESNAYDILEGFEARSKEIKREGFIEENYREFAKNYMNNYLRKLAGYGKWKSRFDRFIFSNKMIQKKYNKQDLLAIRNYIECEAHRELLLEGIKGEIEGV